MCGVAFQLTYVPWFCRAGGGKQMKPPAETILNATATLLLPKEVLYIATDERDKSFFNPFTQDHRQVLRSASFFLFLFFSPFFLPIQQEVVCRKKRRVLSFVRHRCRRGSINGAWGFCFWSVFVKKGVAILILAGTRRWPCRIVGSKIVFFSSVFCLFVKLSEINGRGMVYRTYHH